MELVTLDVPLPEQIWQQRGAASLLKHSCCSQFVQPGSATIGPALQLLAAHARFQLFVDAQHHANREGVFFSRSQLSTAPIIKPFYRHACFPSWWQVRFLS